MILRLVRRRHWKIQAQINSRSSMKSPGKLIKLSVFWVGIRSYEESRCCGILLKMTTAILELIGGNNFLSIRAAANVRGGAINAWPWMLLLCKALVREGDSVFACNFYRRKEKKKRKKWSSTGFDPVPPSQPRESKRRLIHYTTRASAW